MPAPPDPGNEDERSDGSWHFHHGRRSWSQADSTRAVDQPHQVGDVFLELAPALLAQLVHHVTGRRPR